MTKVVNVDEIYQQEQSNRPATPYFLVYLKDESKDELVNSVCRDIVEEAPTFEDAAMDDAPTDFPSEHNNGPQSLENMFNMEPNPFPKLEHSYQKPGVSW